MDTQLVKNILATITYYDVLDYPMTSFEIWRHMIVAPAQDHGTKTWRLDEVVIALDSSEVREYVDMKNGFYVLIGRKELISQRRQRELLSVTKMQKLQRYVRFLRYVPFVRMIALTGRLSYKNGEDSSDLDVLVACKKGHIWTGRFLMTLTTHVMGIRRHGDKHADRVCLNYYITDEALVVPTKDLYGAHEYSFIMPLFGYSLFEKFVQANTWIRQYKPQYMTRMCGNNFCQDFTKKKGRTKIFFEKIFFFPFIEKTLRTLQRNKILANPKTQLDGAVIITNDEHLVFLPKPHGPRVFEVYIKRYEALEIPWR